MAFRLHARLFCCCSLLLFACQGWQSAPALKERPNIIFIMADDLGYADLGCYGQSHIQTPHLDKMAVEGLRFTQTYAGSTVCAPSRSALMTGLHTGHTRVRGNFGKTGVLGLAGKKGRVPLKEEDLTVAEVLKRANYVTAMAGKWGLGEPNTTGHPNLQGFDEFFGYLNQRRAHNYYPEYLWHNTERVMLTSNKDGYGKEYAHDLITEFALDFVKTQADTNFFLYLPYTIPHAQYQIPDTFPYQETDWEWKEKVHAAMITRMDRDIGKLFELLHNLQIDSRTWVFFCSDNGAAERWEGRFDSSGKLRGRKRDMFEGGIRTPMIVWQPEHISAGQVSHMPWYFPDVLPTLAGLAGAPIPKGLDGRSILPALLGQAQSMKDRYFYWEFHERGFQRAIRWNQWKAIQLTPEGPLMLFDLSVDESETENVAHQHPELIAQFEAYLTTARSPSIDWPGK